MQFISTLRKAFSRKKPSGKHPTNTASLSSIPVTHQTGSRIHALVIGINNYAKLRPLSGAAADAEAVEEFLATDLNVPCDQIISLRNGAASRTAIIEAFLKLQTDPRIRKGDPIIIFYAGHGGLAHAQSEWKLKYDYREIQVIFSCDYDTELSGLGGVVSCIPDQTIRALLNELATAKGNNITVIFDCCYAGSGSRSDSTSSPARIARYAEARVRVPENIDENLVASYLLSNNAPQSDASETRSPILPLHTDQASHIHFAACGSEERAWEEHGRGIFTAALLKCIRADGANNITNRNLLVSLPDLPGQTPHCYGVHKFRMLFSTHVPPPKNALVLVKREGGQWILQAGAASGVTIGSVWELYEKKTEASQRLGLFHAHALHSLSAILQPDPGTCYTPENSLSTHAGAECAYARQIRAGSDQKLRVYFSPEAKRLILPAQESTIEMDKRSIGENEYAIHSNHSSADLSVELCYPESSPSEPSWYGMDPEVSFRFHDPHVERHGVNQLRERKRAQKDEVEAVLLAAARWNWHLRRTGSPNTTSFVSMEVLKLGTMYGDYMMPTDGPLENLSNAGVVDLTVKEEDQYGIRLYNRASASLYVRMFYFDTASFSIVDMFGHNRANGRSDPDIPPHGQLTIGDGSNGGALLSFGLEPGVDIEIGFLKVFWSTDPLELDDLAQGSVFGPGLYEDSNARKVGPVKRHGGKEQIWGTIAVTLVQRA